MFFNQKVHFFFIQVVEEVKQFHRPLKVTRALAPCLRCLMGRWAWWMPGWLDRVVPHISIEGEEYFAARDAAASRWRSLDQPQSDRITISHAFVRLDRGDDREYEPADGDDDADRNC